MTLQTTAEEIFVVDDEPAICELLSAMFTLAGYRVTSFPDGDSFLAAAQKRIPAGVLLDVNMPGRSGLDVLRDLNARRFPAPIFMISGHGDVTTVVDAIKMGAFDFIEKPFEPRAVVDRVRETLTRSPPRDEREHGALSQPFPGRDLLTPREREVLAQVAGGCSNKEAGRELGISPRTVEVHRARIMEKLGAKNAADLVRIVLSERRV